MCQASEQLSTCAHVARDKVISCVHLLPCLSCLSVCLFVSTKITNSPNPGCSLVLNTFKLCKLWKTTLCVLFFLFARYALQALKSSCFELVSWARLSTTPRYLATCTMWDDGFSVPRVHYTVCTCEMTVCSYPHENTKIGIWNLPGERSKMSGWVLISTKVFPNTKKDLPQRNHIMQRHLASILTLEGMKNVLNVTN